MDSSAPVPSPPGSGTPFGTQEGHDPMVITVASLLRINGHPGHYVRIAGHWRLEEVGAGTHSLTPQTTPPLPFPAAQGASGKLSFLPLHLPKGPLGPPTLLAGHDLCLVVPCSATPAAASLTSSSRWLSSWCSSRPLATSWSISSRKLPTLTLSREEPFPFLSPFLQ